MSPKSNKIWALVDVQWLMYRAHYAIRDLSHDELPTAVIFGFLEQLRSVASDPRIMSNQCALFFDSKSSYRRLIFPEYKAKRRDDKTPEEKASLDIMHEQVKFLLKEMLPDCGFRVYRQPGLESDDLIAQAALQLDKGTELAAVMVTADGDLWQCITGSGTVCWYDPSRNNYLDYQGFWAKKGVYPDQWATVKSIVGCPGDNIPGVYGIGETSAIQYVTNQIKKGSNRQLLIDSKDGQKAIEETHPLVTLPYPKTKPIDLQPPEYKPDRFFAWAEKLGFASFLDGGRRRQWEYFFSGVMAGENRVTPRKRGEGLYVK